MDQQYSQINDQGQRSVSPVRFDYEGSQIKNSYYNGMDQGNLRQSITSSNSFGQQAFVSPQKRVRPKIFENTPPYLQQTAAHSNANLSFGSPSNPNYNNANNTNNNLDMSLQACSQQVSQLIYDKEILQQDISTLQTQVNQLDCLLQQERRINRSVATELMTKVPTAEKAIIQLNAENLRLQDQLEQDKKLCSQNYLKSLELENLKLKVQNKQLNEINTNLSKTQNSQRLNQSSPLKASPNKKPFIKISLNCPNEDDIEIVNNNQQQSNIEERQRSLNQSPLQQNSDEYHLQNYQIMEAKLMKLESYAEILKQDNDQLEENNRSLNKKLKALTFEKEQNDNDYQQKILKLESLVTTLEYQLRKLKNQQDQQLQLSGQNNNGLEQQPSSKIERNYQSNSNTIRILHDGDVNIKIEGEALNKITSVSVIQH